MRWLLSVACIFGVTTALAYGCSDDDGPSAGLAEAGSDVTPPDVVEEPQDAAVDRPPLDPTCIPQPVPAFEPTWRPPRPPSSDCAIANGDGKLLIDTILKCLLQAPDDPYCPVLPARPETPGCERCLFDDPDASLSGPIIIDDDGTVTLNVGACLAIVTKADDLEANKCGAYLSGLDQCTRQACTSCQKRDPYQNDLQSCMIAARTTVCRDALARIGQCETLLNEGVRGQACAPGNDLVRTASTYGALFCLADAGDASADAAAE
jgi:hypothetical protein